MPTRRHALQFLSSALAASRLPTAHAAPAPLRAPIELVGSRVVIAVTLNGTGPFLFAIDTGGAVSLIREDLAARLNLPRTGEVHIGVSGQSGGHPAYDVANLVIGGIIRQPHAQLISVVNFGFGDGISGSLGSGLMTTLVSELDFDAREWRVWTEGRPDPSGFTPLDVDITRKPATGGSPFIVAPGAVNGSRQQFLLDTAAESFVRLNNTTARKLGLWTSDRPYAPLRDGARIARIDRLEFGGIPFERPLALLLPDDREADISDGLIGLPILRQFNLTLDPQNERLWIRRNSLTAPQYTYPLSGLWFDRHHNDFVITDVGPGSPAKAAGLQPGNRILGTDATTLATQLHGPAGSTLQLPVEQDGRQRIATLHLQPYL